MEEIMEVLNKLVGRKCNIAIDRKGVKVFDLVEREMYIFKVPFYVILTYRGKILAHFWYGISEGVIKNIEDNGKRILVSLEVNLLEEV